MTRYETLQIILTAFLLAAAIIAACIYGCQLNEMQKSTVAATKAANAAEASVTLAQANAHLDQRAWIAVGNISGAPNVNDVFRVSIVFQNVGKTPAKKVRIVPIAEPRPDGSPPDFENRVQETAKHYESQHNIIVSDAVFPPNASSSSTLVVSDGPLKPEALAALKGAARIFVYGKVTYEDVFGTPHWITFCNLLTQTDEGGWQYVTYSQYNDSDDNA